MLNSLLKAYTTWDNAGYEQIFFISLAWVLGGPLELPGKDKLKKQLKDKMGSAKELIPRKIESDKESIFDYYLAKEGNSVVWKQLNERKRDIPEEFNYSNLYIPTLDTTRVEYLTDLVLSINNLADMGQKSVLIVGSSGTAKTSAVIVYSESKTDKLFKTYTFSALTTPSILHNGIESELVRKRARNFEPEGDKIMVMFFDDINMPMPNRWGYQPTLELIRQLLEQSGMYFLERKSVV